MVLFTPIVICEISPAAIEFLQGLDVSTPKYLGQFHLLFGNVQIHVATAIKKVLEPAQSSRT